MASKHSARVNISSTQVQRKFGDIVRRVYSGEEHFVVERDGLPVAAIISMEEYREMQQRIEQEVQAKEAKLKKFAQITRQFAKEAEKRGITEEELMNDLEATRQEVFEEMYGRISIE